MKKVVLQVSEILRLPSGSRPPKDCFPAFQSMATFKRWKITENGNTARPIHPQKYRDPFTYVFKLKFNILLLPNCLYEYILLSRTVHTEVQPILTESFNIFGDIYSQFIYFKQTARLINSHYTGFSPTFYCVEKALNVNCIFKLSAVLF